jgi:hypothetical protein
MKTNYQFIGPIRDIREFACDNLYFTYHIKTGEGGYDCQRLSGHYCYGTGWCPLRYTSGEFTPKVGSSGSWRFY